MDNDERDEPRRRAANLVKRLGLKLEPMEEAYAIQEIANELRSYGSDRFQHGESVGSNQAACDVLSFAEILEERKADPQVVDIVRRVFRLMVR